MQSAAIHATLSDTNSNTLVGNEIADEVRSKTPQHQQPHSQQPPDRASSSHHAAIFHQRVLASQQQDLLRDPIAVGSYLAAEGEMARIQARHTRSAGGGQRRHDERHEEDMVLNEIQQHTRKHRAQSAHHTHDSASSTLQVNLSRRMHGIVGDEFYSSLHACVRGGQLESDEKGKGGMRRVQNQQGHHHPDEEEHQHQDSNAATSDHRLHLPECVLPATITYSKGIPQSCFLYNHGTIGKHTHSHSQQRLDEDEIIEWMSDNSRHTGGVKYRTQWMSERSCDIVAVFYHTDSSLTPLYLTRKQMKSFVRQDAFTLHCTGVLQKFVPPSTEHNHLIRCTWTPSFTFLEQRQAGYKLDAKRIRIEDRVETYETDIGLGSEIKEYLMMNEHSRLWKMCEEMAKKIAKHIEVIRAATERNETHASKGAPATPAAGLLSDRSGGGTTSTSSPLLAQLTLYFKLAPNPSAGQRSKHNNDTIEPSTKLFLLLCDEIRWRNASEMTKEVALNHRHLYRASSVRSMDEEAKEEVESSSPLPTVPPAHHGAGENACINCAQPVRHNNSVRSHPSSSQPIDLRTILLYRLSLCSPQLLQPSLDAETEAYHKQQHDLLWNLVHPILVPNHIEDQREFTAHLMYSHTNEMTAGLEEVKQHIDTSSSVTARNRERTTSLFDNRVPLCSSCLAIIKAWSNSASSSNSAQPPDVTHRLDTPATIRIREVPLLRTVGSHHHSRDISIQQEPQCREDLNAVLNRMCTSYLSYELLHQSSLTSQYSNSIRSTNPFVVEHDATERHQVRPKTSPAHLTRADRHQRIRAVLDSPWSELEVSRSALHTPLFDASSHLSSEVTSTSQQHESTLTTDSQASISPERKPDPTHRVYQRPATSHSRPTQRQNVLESKSTNINNITILKKSSAITPLEQAVSRPATSGSQREFNLRFAINSKPSLFGAPPELKTKRIEPHARKQSASRVRPSSSYGARAALGSSTSPQSLRLDLSYGSTNSSHSRDTMNIALAKYSKVIEREIVAMEEEEKGEQSNKQNVWLQRNSILLNSSSTPTPPAIKRKNQSNSSAKAF